MKRNPYTTNLTKDYIESKVSQELIVSKYLDIPIEVVQDCIKNNHLITSVLEMMIIIKVWVFNIMLKVD